jgi:hypothetical protein
VHDGLSRFLYPLNMHFLPNPYKLFQPIEQVQLSAPIAKKVEIVAMKKQVQTDNMHEY